MILVMVVIKELLASLDPALPENTDSVVPPDQHDLGEAVGLVAVVGKPRLVALAHRIQNLVFWGQGLGFQGLKPGQEWAQNHCPLAWLLETAGR